MKISLLTKLPLLAVCIGLTSASAFAATEQEEANGHEKLFRALDANSDGIISKDEVDKKREKHFQRLVRLGDENRDGKLSKQEFLAVAKAVAKPAEEEDADNNGERDGKGKKKGKGEGKKEGKKGKRNPKEIFKRLDKNDDGTVSQDEIPEKLKERIGDALGNEDLTEEKFVKILKDRRAKAKKSKGGKADADPIVRTAGKKEEKDGDRRSRGFGQGRRGPGGPPAIFRKLDTNDDHKLSKEELSAVVKKFDELDKNGDGYLEPRELFGRPDGPRGGREGNRGPEGARRRGPGEGDGERGRRFFERLDKNEDGKISKEEAPERLQERFGKIDKDDDGFITKEELKAGRPGKGQGEGGKKKGGGKKRGKPNKKEKKDAEA